jgi:hypothetical protein
VYRTTTVTELKSLIIAKGGAKPNDKIVLIYGGEVMVFFFKIMFFINQYKIWINIQTDENATMEQYNVLYFSTIRMVIAPPGTEN